MSSDDSTAAAAAEASPPDSGRVQGLGFRVLGFRV